MTDLTIHKEETTRAPTLARDWDPFRMMRELFRSDPFYGMTPLWTAERGFAPSFEVRENPEAFVFKADVPGVREQDLDIQLANNRLTVSGKRESEKKSEKDTIYCYERSYGSFTRTFTLPEGIATEKTSAQLKEGVLQVVVPKAPEAQPKKISIKAK